MIITYFTYVTQNTQIAKFENLIEKFIITYNTYYFLLVR